MIQKSSIMCLSSNEIAYFYKQRKNKKYKTKTKKEKHYL